MPHSFSLEEHGIHADVILRNAPPPVLYEEALRHESGSAISDTGALIALSGEKTGRSPKDKRIVRRPESEADVWWGPVNVDIDTETFKINRQRAIDYLNTQKRLYVVDGFAGWDPAHRIKVRIIACRAYHALFMHNMLIRPTEEELKTFRTPDYVIYNAGKFPANPYTKGMTSAASIDLCFEEAEMVILGTEYAGEMKKGIFTVMHYLMPKRDVLSMHCSANQGEDGDVSLFFGLSGTGKTTLSTDPKRHLIGDDEHCWSEDGVFNIEGGCYAKCIDLSPEREPDIYQAIRFGAILENVIYDPRTRSVDFTDTSITQNTRTSYPIEFIPNARIPCRGGHPDNIIFLTCDAFGVLPPVSKLSPSQAMYHFISGYTAKVAGTEVGIVDPVATFSACFGAAFLVWHPTRYAEMLAEKMRRHGTRAWLVNTGWTAGPFGIGHRMKLSHTRNIIDAIHDGALNEVDVRQDPVFGVTVPTSCPGVPSKILNPRETWTDKEAFDEKAQKLARLFHENFETYASAANDEILAAAPVG